MGYCCTKRQERGGGKSVICSELARPSGRSLLWSALLSLAVLTEQVVFLRRSCWQEPSGTVPHAAFLIVGDSVRLQKLRRVYAWRCPRIILVDTFKDEAEKHSEWLKPLREVTGIRWILPENEAESPSW